MCGQNLRCTLNRDLNKWCCVYLELLCPLSLELFLWTTLQKGVIVLINCGSLLLNSAKKQHLNGRLFFLPQSCWCTSNTTNTSHNINCDRCVCVSHLRDTLSPNSCILVIDQVQRSIYKMAGYCIQSKTGLRSINMLKKEQGQTSYISCLLG